MASWPRAGSRLATLPVSQDRSPGLETWEGRRGHLGTEALPCQHASQVSWVEQEAQL